MTYDYDIFYDLITHTFIVVPLGSPFGYSPNGALFGRVDPAWFITRPVGTIHGYGLVPEACNRTSLDGEVSL